MTTILRGQEEVELHRAATDHELAELGIALAGAVGRVQTAEADKAKANADANTTLKTLRKDVRELQSQVSAGQMKYRVLADKVLDLSTGLVVFKHTETGEVLYKRDATDQEKQLTLDEAPGAGEEPGSMDDRWPLLGSVVRRYFPDVSDLALQGLAIEIGRAHAGERRLATADDVREVFKGVGLKLLGKKDPLTKLADELMMLDRPPAANMDALRAAAESDERAEADA